MMKVKSQMTINLVEVVEQIIKSVFNDHVVAGHLSCHQVEEASLCCSVPLGGVGTSWECQIIEVLQTVVHLG